MTDIPIASRDIRHAALRAALKVRFPATKFSVTGSRGTGYGWSRIGWTDGPTSRAVRDVAARFFGSYFDGSDDGYHGTGNLFVWQGTTYKAGGDGFNWSRTISPTFARRLLAYLVTYWATPEVERPELIERTDWQGRPDWSLKLPDGRDGSNVPAYNGADGLHNWTDVVYAAAENGEQLRDGLAEITRLGAAQS